MNAYELADKLEEGDVGHPTLDKAATMLRQQQAEIEAYKNLVKAQDEKIVDLAFEKVYAERSAEVVAELYTHPVKELTDEEIEGWITDWAKDLYGTLYVEPTDHQRTMAIKMARAILRKAQEK